MRDTIYLVFSKSGVHRMTKRPPDLNGGEFAIKQRVSIPDDFFNRLTPVVDLDIPEGFVRHPEVQIEPQSGD